MDRSPCEVSKDEYAKLHRSQRWKSVDRERLSLARKTFVQQLSRIGCQHIENQRKRGEIKAEIYNHLTPILVMHEKEHAEVRRYYQTVIKAICAVLSMSVLFIVLALKFASPHL